MLNVIPAKQSIEQLNFLTWPTFAADEKEKVAQVLSSGKVNYWTGEEGRNFEKEFAQFVGTNYAVALTNGTVALEAALAALNIGPGDEVITTSRTFIASASCVIMRGAIPVFADVDSVSQNITVNTIQKALTPKTKAIIVVHLAGWPCDMPSIMDFAKKNNLFVIEDCAQAHGATIHNQPMGSWGDVAAFSFCQDKIITTGGEGGMVTTNNPDVWEKIWALKDHGRSYDAVYHREHPPGHRWIYESFGTNWRMLEIQAAIGRLQLKKLAHWIKARQQNAAILTQHFKNISAFRVTEPPENIQHAFYKYYVFVESEKLKSDWTRDRIMQTINEKGVPCYSGICSEIYLEKAFTQNGLVLETRLPVAKMLGETSLMFLVHPTLTDEHMMRTVEVVNEVMEMASFSPGGVVG